MDVRHVGYKLMSYWLGRTFDGRKIKMIGGIRIPMDAEENRNARRDRKRKTRMVVDNAGVKQIIAALKLKRAKR